MEENKMNEINEKIKSDLTTLFSSMKKDLILFYFFRNNSRFTNRYYYRFISVIGAETYHSLDSVKYEWESARYSFDKMYGLVAAWKDNGSFISDNLFEKELKNLQTAVNELSDEIKKMNTKIDVIKVPHHGSKYSSSEEFIDFLNGRRPCGMRP